MSAISSRPPAGDAAVAKATGRTWAAWRQRLDRAGAADWPHQDTARHLAEKEDLSGWWAQMVTVGYERLIGRRITGQSCAGKFNAGASKTLPVSAPVAHGWFADAKKRRRWLEAKVTLRKSTAPKSVRLGFPDGSIAGIAITAQSPAKCSVGVSHDGFATLAASNRHKKFWRDALARLAEKISS